jgi:hypothetical protein
VKRIDKEVIPMMEDIIKRFRLGKLIYNPYSLSPFSSKKIGTPIVGTREASKLLD